MPTQEQAHYHSNRTDAEEQHAAEIDELVEDAMDRAIADAKVRGAVAKELTDDMKTLLDSIDEALGENVVFAEEFMRDWVQKGGQ